MRATSLPVCLLQIAVLQLALSTGSASVLPRPNCKTEKATTQILNPGKNYSDETVLVVTSSELPKQIPPPPTPTKSNFVTPHYEVRWESKESEGRKRSGSLPIPYNALESAVTFQKIF